MASAVSGVGGFELTDRERDRLVGLSWGESTVDKWRKRFEVEDVMAGMPERHTHDYARHGGVDLFAAFNIADGTVITRLHHRHHLCFRGDPLARAYIALGRSVRWERDENSRTMTATTPDAGTDS